MNYDKIKEIKTIKYDVDGVEFNNWCDAVDHIKKMTITELLIKQDKLLPSPALSITNVIFPILDDLVELGLLGEEIVYVDGMKFPESCSVCTLRVEDFMCACLWENTNLKIVEGRRLENCPLKMERI